MLLVLFLAQNRNKVLSSTAVHVTQKFYALNTGSKYILG